MTLIIAVCWALVVFWLIAVVGIVADALWYQEAGGWGLRWRVGLWFLLLIVSTTLMLLLSVFFRHNG